jgi:hypothetical protein
MHQAIYDRLIQVARAQDTVSYSEISPLAMLDMDNPADRNVMKNLLDDINRYEHQEGRPMLSAVVVHRQDNIPGEGFFTCARNLGRFTGTRPVEELEFWVAEIRLVYDVWSNR